MSRKRIYRELFNVREFLNVCNAFDGGYSTLGVVGLFVPCFMPTSIFCCCLTFRSEIFCSVPAQIDNTLFSAQNHFIGETPQTLTLTAPVDFYPQITYGTFLALNLF